jgi:tRNA 2-thiocytidine biosynthesis protein TtcA
VPTHLLDRGLNDFASVRTTGTPVPGGDAAFDDDLPAAADAARPDPDD